MSTTIPPAQLSKLKELEKRIGYRFHDISLLRNALVHASYVNESETQDLQDNERLEFVGDAVLEFVVSEYLYRKFPGQTEGTLTVVRSSIVGRRHCAAMAKQLELDDCLLVGKGERNAAAGMKKSILANALEALIASIYFDGGMGAARRFILKMLEQHIPASVTGDENFKAHLQALCQRKAGVLPSYRVISTEGPDHQKTFEVEVSIKGAPWGTGRGASKKEAQQEAAKKALEKMAEESLE